MTEFETTYCERCSSELEAGQVGLCQECLDAPLETLLNEARSLQQQFWTKLRELEDALDVDVSSVIDLDTVTIETLRASSAEAAPYRCKGCNREESVCSADPCPSVVADRAA